MDLISNGEWGVGLELLCDQLAEHAIDLNLSEAMEVREFARTMDIDISTLCQSGFHG